MSAPIDRHHTRSAGPAVLSPDAATTCPDLIAPVVGFRDWRIVDGQLCSPWTATVWEDSVHAATCRPQRVEDFVREPHRAPHRDCSCGVHAYHAAGSEFSKVDFRGVSGIVTLWGHIEVDGDGMRAAFAKVHALGVYRRWGSHQKQAVAEVARSLGIDLLDFDELADAAAMYASPLPCGLIPARSPQPCAGRTLLVGR